MDILQIIYTDIEDLPFVNFLLEEALAYQRENGYNLWTNFDMEIIRKEIENKSQYKILIENEIACVFSVVYYDKALWKEKEKDDALYLHRILVNPNHKGKRLFGKILEWSVDNAKNNNRKFIRMDTWADNPTIIAYYQTFGFNFIENIITTEDPTLAKQYWNKFLALLEYKIGNLK